MNPKNKVFSFLYFPLLLLLLFIAALLISTAGQLHEASKTRKRDDEIRHTLIGIWEELYVNKSDQKWSPQLVTSALKKHAGKLPIQNFVVFEAKEEDDMVVMYREALPASFGTVLTRAGYITYRHRDYKDVSLNVREFNVK